MPINRDFNLKIKVCKIFLNPNRNKQKLSKNINKIYSLKSIASRKCKWKIKTDPQKPNKTKLTFEKRLAV